MQLYKANKSNKGCACSLSFNSKESALFIQLIKQVSYDEARHLGSFSGGEKITIKSSLGEIGSLIDALKRNVEYSTVHQSKDATTQIWFAPYLVGEGDARVQRGYGLRVSKKTKDGQEFKFLMPFNFGEGQLLQTYLDFVLRHIFSADYAEQKKRYKEKLDNQPIKVVPSTEAPQTEEI